MILAGLVDAGADLQEINRSIGSLGLGELKVAVREKNRAGLRCAVADVSVPSRRVLRHLSDVEEIIGRSTLSDWAKSKSLMVFRALAEAEAHVHGTSVEKVHFHEVGALDTIVDVVAAAVALESLEARKIYCGPIGVGTGHVDCEHGRFPVPAPATAQLLKGWPVKVIDVDGEISTPTGVAILTTLGVPGPGRAAFTLDSVGVATGTRTFEGHQALLRVFLGDQSEKTPGDEVVELAATIDDTTPEQLAALFEFLPEAGALDVVVTAVVMKKNRPGHELKVLAPVEKLEAVVAALFKHSTTLGIRVLPVARRTLQRDTVTVETGFGRVTIKRGLLEGRAVTVSPEYDDCLALARKSGVSVDEVMRRALAAYEGLRK